MKLKNFILSSGTMGTIVVPIVAFIACSPEEESKTKFNIKDVDGNQKGVGKPREKDNVNDKTHDHDEEHDHTGDHDHDEADIGDIDSKYVDVTQGESSEDQSHVSKTITITKSDIAEKIEQYISYKAKKLDATKELGATMFPDDDKTRKLGYTITYVGIDRSSDSQGTIFRKPDAIKVGDILKVLIKAEEGYTIEGDSEFSIEVSNILLTYEKQDIINMITINDDDEFASTATKAKNGFELNFVSVVDGEGKTVIKNYLQAGNTVTVEVDFEIGYTFEDNTLLSGDDNNEVKITLQ